MSGYQDMTGFTGGVDSTLEAEINADSGDWVEAWMDSDARVREQTDARVAANYAWRAMSVRRAWRVGLASVIAGVLTLGYVTGDVLDLVPGPLSFSSAQTGTSAQPPLSVRPASQLVKQADLDKPIDADQARQLVDAFAASAGVGDSASVVVVDAKGKVAASLNPDAQREPASTMKTLTALAAATTLDMGSRFETDVYLDHPVGAEAVLTLKGNGDMLLGAGQNDPNHVNGRAGLASLADQVASSLKEGRVNRVRLVCDDSLFGAVRSPEHIAQNNDQGNYFTGVSSLAVDGGRLWGGTAHSPDDFNDYPALSTTTAADTQKTFASLLQDRGINVELGGVASTAEQLTQSGAGEDGSDVPQAGGAKRVGYVRSATLSEILGFALRHSDNTLAEEFGRLVALHAHADNSPAGAVQAVRSALTALGLDVNGVTMADCSGLSPGSSLSALTLAQVQTHYLLPGAAVGASEGLSVPGLAGTARNRLADDSAAGLLRVKTGSLQDVTSMAGNVSRKHGGVLAFAVIVNRPADLGGAKQAVDRLMASLADL